MPRVSRRYRTAISALTAVSAIAFTAGGAAASTDSEEPRLAAVYFELEEGVAVESGPLSSASASRPAIYQSFTVLADGESRRMEPIGGRSSVRLEAAHAASVTVYEGAAVQDWQTPDFGDALAESLVLPRVDGFARLAGDSGTLSLDLIFDRPLGPDDFLFIQEAGGDASVELTPVDETGQAVGPSTHINGPYQWNIGRSDIGGTPLWAHVVRAPLRSDGLAAQGLRVTTTDAEIKILALVDVVDATAASASQDSSAPSIDASRASEVGDYHAQTVAAASATAGALTEEQVPSIAGSLTLVDPDSLPDANAAASDPVLDPDTAPEALAMTGIPTEPWVFVALAMGLIFFGWTLVLAVGDEAAASVRKRTHANRSGHGQLDCLGFD